MNRQTLADLMVEKINGEKDRCKSEFQTSGRIQSFIVDNLLPDDLAKNIAQKFPASEDMTLRNNFRERKYVSSQMNHYDPLLEETVFAFQQPQLIKAISDVTGFHDLYPDEILYAAGISGMTKGCYLKPHLDNSHDLSGKKYRVLNLLYYISPDWKEEYGGNLELWDQGVREKPRTIVSRFNRLAVMTTLRSSWHSVSEVKQDDTRRCISSYYFSPSSLERGKYYHVTSFRGRPEDGIKKIIFETDGFIRNVIGKTVHAVTKGNIRTFHIYKPKKKPSI